MRQRLHILESESLQHHLHIDRLTADTDRLQFRLSETIRERDEIAVRADTDRATVGLLEARLNECEERILVSVPKPIKPTQKLPIPYLQSFNILTAQSFNTLLSQTTDPYKTKLKLYESQIAKLVKENELLKTRKLQVHFPIPHPTHPIVLRFSFFQRPTNGNRFLKKMSSIPIIPAPRQSIGLETET